jgi:hypothetical protein
MLSSHLRLNLSGNLYRSLIRHGPHRKRRVQQFFHCWVSICYRGNVFTDPLPSSDRGIFTEALPSNDKRIHIQTQRLMGGIFDYAFEMGSGHLTTQKHIAVLTDGRVLTTPAYPPELFGGKAAAAAAECARRCGILVGGRSVCAAQPTHIGSGTQRGSLLASGPVEKLAQLQDHGFLGCEATCFCR